MEQISALIEKVDLLKQKYPDVYEKKKSARVLATTKKVISCRITCAPGANEFRQGSSLGDAHKHWFRAKFLQQYRIYYRYSERYQHIVLGWLNNDETLRSCVSKLTLIKFFRVC
ncbi:type II toxin-antitoxin system YhaV family toxin [Acerihabitans sp.]|uniref:type II toxin-antitoxin system YhaV family toxin n=1 Tax=Acerihabitans sp. TaxID=2811394 RepID=UPI002ED9C707